MSIAGRVYLERGEPVTVLVQWGLKSRGETHGGPRNVMIQRADGSRVVRPFRGLRSTRTGDTGGVGGDDDMGVSQHRDEGEEVTTTVIMVEDGPDFDDTGDEHQVWYATPIDDDGEPTGPTYKHSTESNAFVTAGLMAKKHGVEVVT